MRHRVAHRKLGRVTEHRIALLRNQAEALLRHERIETTMPKAKELRPFVEKLITTAKRGIAEGAETPKAVHARRMVLEDIPNKAVVSKLFDDLAPRFQGRPGGYTRILRLGFRRGDAAEVAQIELVGSEYNPRLAESEGETSAARKRGVGGRLRAAAERLRGKKRAGDAAEGGEKAKPAKAARAAKPKAEKAAKPKAAKAAKATKATKATKAKGNKTSDAE